MSDKSSEFEIIIEPGKGFEQYWKDLWRYRELFYFLAWRDILVRYKQTIIGIAWSIIRPLLTMIIFTIVFGKIAKLDSNDIPYPILVYSALLPWQFFAGSLGSISGSVVGNSSLVSKIYFPRLIIPISSVIVNFVDFIISFAILLGLMVWFRFMPDIKIVMLPIFMFVACLAAVGLGLLIASLNVKYRDFNHIIPFIIQLGLYVSPVGFSSSIIPDEWRLLYSFNPMVGVIDGFRWAILGSGIEFHLIGFIISGCLALCLFILGLKYFRKTEKAFADII